MRSKGRRTASEDLRKMWDAPGQSLMSQLARKLPVFWSELAVQQSQPVQDTSASAY